MRLVASSSQSNEARLLAELVRDAPKTFVEFGFHPIEFNCIELARSRDWRGLLIDGDADQVRDGQTLWPSLEIRRAFLTLENLSIIRDAFPALGVLSIDVDGNDYWFLRALIDLRPSVIIVEYNSTFGARPITVPYAADFDRHARHPRGWYHGASLTALASLCRSHGYGLAAVSDGGSNAFFTRDGKLDPAASWRPNRLREAYSGVPHDRQWDEIKHMPFVEV